MPDTISSNPSTPITMAEVAEALRKVKLGNLEALGALPLAKHPLVAECRLVGELQNDAVRGVLLKELLRWGVDKLCPLPLPWSAEEREYGKEERYWKKTDHWLYNTLYYPYFAGWLFSALATKLKHENDKALGEGAIFKKPSGLRPRALAQVVDLLQREAQKGQHLAERQRYAHHARWANLTDEARVLLTRAAPLRTPFSPKLLYKCAGAPAPSSEMLAALCAAGLLQGDERLGTFAMDPSFRTYIRERFKGEGHKLALDYNKKRKADLEVAYHLCCLNAPRNKQQAARLLLRQPDRLMQEHSLPEIAEVLGLIQRSDLSDELWFQLKLLEGDATLAAGEVHTAIALYLSTYQGVDKERLAAAAHRLGRAYRRLDPQEAGHYYERCSAFLRDIPTPSPLLVPIFVDRAWSFIQENRDLVEAERLLREAENVIKRQGSNKALEARLLNAQAGLCIQQGQPDRGIAHRWRAYIAAQEAQDRGFEASIAKNLGFDYAQLRERYDMALHLLERARILAVEAGEHQLEGLCLKDMGNCCFWQEDYLKAISYYKKARVIFQAGGNTNWLIAVYLDLTEAYAEVHRTRAARFCFQAAVELNNRLKHSDYQSFITYLLRQYPTLRVRKMSLSPRQRWAVDYVAKNGSITSPTYCEQHNCSPKTANRDMNDLCQRGLFRVEGKARATVYRFAPPPAPSREASRPVVSKGASVFHPSWHSLPFSLALLLPSALSDLTFERTPTQPVEAVPPVWFSPPRVLRWPSSWSEL